MTNRALVCLALLFLLSQVACQTPRWLSSRVVEGAEAPVEILIAGEPDMHPLVNALIDAHGAKASEVQFILETDQRQDGLEAVRDGGVDIGLHGAQLPPDLTEDAWISLPVALDGIAVIVHPDSPIRNLSLMQLHRIYTGRMLNWSSLGGPDQGVQVLSQDLGSGARQVFRSQIMQGAPVTRQAILAPTSKSAVDYVGKHPGAVGYVSTAYLRPGVKGILVEGLAPDDETIARGAYPLTRPLYLIARADASPEIQAFLSFVLSAEGQRIVGHYHTRVR
jgi:phosphate transport system substrate-binding protein